MTEMRAERDRLAELCGWVWYPYHGEMYVPGAGHWGGGLWRVRINDHPFEDGDLTALAAAWPEGWFWWRSAAEWLAQAPDTDFIRVWDTGNEYADRLLLTIAVLEAGKGTP